MSFIVSARKYRPVTFDSVVGQRHVTDTLKNAIRNNHIAHAFLFCGPRGVGKTTCARILAKVLNCQNLTPETEPCDQCESCLGFNKNASLNIYELDAASNNSVEHIRSLVEQVRFPPQNGRYKIYIIDEVHMLSTQAFNAFLKTLEEPPPYVIFILATTEKHKIIPTILSRCQIFDFRRIKVQDMSDHLASIAQKENIEADEDALNIIAQKADGGLRDALSIFDRMVSYGGNRIGYEDVINNLNVLDYDYYFKLTEYLLSENVAATLNLFHDVMARGFEGDTFVNGFAEHLRNLLVCQFPETLALLDTGGTIRDRYQQQAALTPRSFILSALALSNDCDTSFKQARNKPLHVELTLLRMSYISRAVSANTLLEQNTSSAEDEKKKPDLATPSPAGTVAPEKQETDKQISAFKEVLSNFRLGDIANDTGNSRSNKPMTPVKPWTIENIRASWAEFGETITSTSQKSSFSSATLELGEGHILIVNTNSAYSQDHIRSLYGLRDFLVEVYGAPTLHLDIKVVRSETPVEIEKPKTLTAKDIYASLAEINPLVSEIQKRFDLRLDK